MISLFFGVILLMTPVTCTVSLYSDHTLSTSLSSVNAGDLVYISISSSTSVSNHAALPYSIVFVDSNNNPFYFEECNGHLAWKNNSAKIGVNVPATLPGGVYTLNINIESDPHDISLQGTSSSFTVLQRTFGSPSYKKTSIVPNLELPKILEVGESFDYSFVINGEKENRFLDYYVEISDSFHILKSFRHIIFLNNLPTQFSGEILLWDFSPGNYIVTVREDISNEQLYFQTLEIREADSKIVNITKNYVPDFDADFPDLHELIDIFHEKYNTLNEFLDPYSLHIGDFTLSYPVLVVGLFLIWFLKRK